MNFKIAVKIYDDIILVHTFVPFNFYKNDHISKITKFYIQ